MADGKTSTFGLNASRRTLANLVTPKPTTASLQCISVDFRRPISLFLSKFGTEKVTEDALGYLVNVGVESTNAKKL